MWNAGDICLTDNRAVFGVMLSHGNLHFALRFLGLLYRLRHSHRNTSLHISINHPLPHTPRTTQVNIRRLRPHFLWSMFVDGYPHPLHTGSANSQAASIMYNTLPPLVICLVISIFILFYRKPINLSIHEWISSIHHSGEVPPSLPLSPPFYFCFVFSSIICQCFISNGWCGGMGRGSLSSRTADTWSYFIVMTVCFNWMSFSKHRALYTT